MCLDEFTEGIFPPHCKKSHHEISPITPGNTLIPNGTRGPWHLKMGQTEDIFPHKDTFNTCKCFLYHSSWNTIHFSHYTKMFPKLVKNIFCSCVLCSEIPHMGKLMINLFTSVNKRWTHYTDLSKKVHFRTYRNNFKMTQQKAKIDWRTLNFNLGNYNLPSKKLSQWHQYVAL